MPHSRNVVSPENTHLIDNHRENSSALSYLGKDRDGSHLERSGKESNNFSARSNGGGNQNGPPAAQSGSELDDHTEKQPRESSARSTVDKFREAPRMKRDNIDSNDFRNHAIEVLGIEDALIEEYEYIEPPVPPPSSFSKTTQIPRWCLLLVSNALIIILIVAFSVVFSFKQATVGLGESCLQNSDCNSKVGLSCTAGKCSCSAVEIWNEIRCIPQRTFNRSCKVQSDCDSLSDLVCLNVTIGSSTDSLCWCSTFRYWTGDQCSNLKTINETCSASRECDYNNFLTCIGGRCDCVSTQFWNNIYCENKRSYGGQCFSTYWCNSATSGLQCSTRQPTAGTCDCLSNQYWWSANSTCFPQLPRNARCSFDYQCITNQSLICSTSTSPPSCQCNAQSWYNTTRCVSKLLFGGTCTSTLQCDTTRFLSCNVTAQMCTCNMSDYIWDGIRCVNRRSIGGDCTSNAQCLPYQNLTCATSGILNGTCVCPTNYYWLTNSSACVLKKLWNSTCGTSFECYDGGYLSCQPNAAQNTTICDCGNYTQYWTGFLSNTYSGSCTPKINYGTPSFTCVSSYQCRDYNYVTCISGQCTCSFDRYWDGTFCAPRLNYSYPCTSTSMCRNWASGPNLQCLTPPSGGSIQQCLCTPTQYFDYCADYCYSSRNWQQSCTINSCFATDMCDQTKSLSCINNICNCSVTQWWNGATCLPKGTNLASCTTGQNFQCQDYNYLACISSQCQCASTYYWSSSSNYCMQKKSYLGPCASTNECLTAAGVGLNCISGQCRCSSGYTWNSAAQQCDPVG